MSDSERAGKRVKARHAAVGRDASHTFPRQPRPSEWGDGLMADVPRNAVGVNEYIRAMSKSHPELVR